MAEPMADRIMAAADNYAGERWAVGAGVTMADDRAESHRATLAALVAEATAERVCRWLEIGDRDWGVDCGGVVVDPPLHQWRFCPWCGGRIELVAESQEATDG